MFGNWKKNSITRKVNVFSYFELSGLRCELTVMPLKRVSGRDRFHDISWIGIMCPFVIPKICDI